MDFRELDKVIIKLHDLARENKSASKLLREIADTISAVVKAEKSRQYE